jgi:2'-5' RNA ligase
MKKTLYVSRKLLNASEFLKWAKEEGFEKTLDADSLHVTIAFSKKEVEWNNIEKETRNVRIKGGQRTISSLGDEGAIVLKFQSKLLEERWKYYLDKGASWDYKQYMPHVSITYSGSGPNIKTIVPYDGELLFGPEILKEVDLDWHKKVKED